MARSKNKKKQPVCGCCGKTGHRIETCTLPGAALICKLRAAAKKTAGKRSGDKFKDDRSHCRSSGSYKRKASKKYVPMKSAKDYKDHARLKASALSQDTIDVPDSIKWLLKMGFLSRSRKCAHCGYTSLKGPLVRKRKNMQDWCHWRCSRNSCNRRVALYYSSVCAGLQMQPPALRSFLLWYCSKSPMKPVLASDAVLRFGISYKQADHCLAALRRQEALAGEREQSKLKLTREVEVDATSLGKFWTKSTNVLFADQIQDLCKKHDVTPKAFPVHIRLVGALQRGGHMVVRFLQPKVTLPKAVPPVEAYREIVRSNLTKMIQAKSPTALYADGALSWQKIAKDLKVPIVQVSHQRKVFAKQVSAPRRGLSTTAGT
ncbi:unnamed protein product [Durusdinium trenchii]|uniref:CCHC-type domain-containing protein n=1 Tax=Durusdinium trenchii TaxID=1381693 RepID=A0ABP0L7F5_9DINO